MHCGMCLPTCPTYDATLNERSSPRGRIAMMRAIADDRLEVSKTFADEMYFCLGCLACQSACPAGVDYTNLFEHARAEIERVGILETPKRTRIRNFALKTLFTSPSKLRFLGRLMRIYQATGLQTAIRKSGFLRLLPKSLRELEPLTPTISPKFTQAHFKQLPNSHSTKYRVGLISGCIQDIAFSEINADTIYVLQKNECEVVLPQAQVCCGSLHGHNGEIETAKELARKNIDAFNAETFDVIITNAGGCGSHLKQYDHLLSDDPNYAQRAKTWSSKVKDIHEFLVEIDFQPPKKNGGLQSVTYHASCHLSHGQKIKTQPIQILKSIPGIDFKELIESEWCCGSAGIYNITQPEMSMKLLDRKMNHIKSTGTHVVATANPGCMVQIDHGTERCDTPIQIKHPITLLANAYRSESSV
ncbi:MAG: (Fe-S)-binding protein [Candidatus Latescibacteria bacterium]|nr:(Fe-S)-binding protein [Candidatus Latescibacterota bacterium]